MLYNRGSYCWMRFKWNGILIQELTRAEDLATAKKILERRRSRCAPSVWQQSGEYHAPEIKGPSIVICHRLRIFNSGNYFGAGLHFLRGFGLLHTLGAGIV